ncbi:surf-like protein [Mortierella alpina]|nr:surf-like protein [Mortierella alpina]
MHPAAPARTAARTLARIQHSASSSCCPSASQAVAVTQRQVPWLHHRSAVARAVPQQKHSYSTLHQSSRTASGRKRWGPVTIGLALCPIITFGLGSWQVQRLRWKVDLIESLEDRMSLDAIPLPRKVNLGAIEDFEYRKVKVTGHYRHDEEILLGPRTRGDGQPGYFLITPFERVNGSKILVRRGWVPREKKDQATRLDGLTEGEVTLEGLLRTGEQKASSFVPENNPEKNEWYSLDLESMAQQSGAQPVVVEMILDTPPHLIKSELIDKDIPVGRSPVVELRNHHKEYIVTWYVLRGIDIGEQEQNWRWMRSALD